MWKEKSRLFDSILILLFLCFVAYSQAEAETIGDDPIATEEILSTGETDDETDQDEPSIEFTTSPDPIFINSFFLSPPFFFTSPIFFPGPFVTPLFVNPFFFTNPVFFPSFFVTPIFANPFFFSFGFSFSFGSPFFFNCPFFFSPFALNSFFFFPHRHHFHHEVHHNSPKIIETGVPIKKPTPIRPNASISSTNTIENRISTINRLDTRRLNRGVSNNPPQRPTNFTEGRFPKGVVSRNPSTITIDPRVANRGTGLRLFGDRDQTTSPNIGASNPRISGNRVGSFNSMRNSGQGFTSFRGRGTTGFSNRGSVSTKFNSGSQTGSRSMGGTSKFSSGFRGFSSGRIGGSSFGRMGGSFRGFGRR